MPRSRPLLLSVSLAVVAAIALASCGEEDAQLLSGETAREITVNLDTVRQLADEGDCAGAESAVEQVHEQVEELREVDPRLKRTLERGVNRLSEVIAECEEPTEAIGPAEIPTEEVEEAEEEPERSQDRGRGDRGADDGEQQQGQRPDSSLPPQSEGEGEAKGREPEGGGEGGSGGEPQEGGSEDESSGGISPGSAVGGEE